MSDESLRTAGILLLMYPTVVFGGASLLWHRITRRTVYYDHSLRCSLWPRPAASRCLFLSIVRPDGERPDRLVDLAYLGAITFTIGTLTLGVGLLRAA
jgi:hypothetical protein